MQERPKGIRELAEQVCVLEADLEAGLGRRDAGQVAAVRVKHDHIVARHKHGYIGQIVDRIETQSKSLQWHTANSAASQFFWPLCRRAGDNCIDSIQEKPTPVAAGRSSLLSCPIRLMFWKSEGVKVLLL